MLKQIALSLKVNYLFLLPSLKFWFLSDALFKCWMIQAYMVADGLLFMYFWEEEKAHPEKARLGITSLKAPV